MARRAGDDWRRQYRVAAGRTLDLSVRLEWGDSGSLEAPIRDTSGRGIGIVIPSGQESGLTPGLDVRGELIDAQDHSNIPFPAIVRHVSPVSNEPGMTKVGLEFGDPSRLIRRVDATLVPLFNRRRYFRVSPSPGLPLEATATNETSTQEARVRDVAAAGISLVLTKAMTEEFHVDQEIKLALTIGVNPTVRHAEGAVIHVSEVRGRYRCGIQFVEDGSIDFKTTRLEIDRFVVERQREDRLIQKESE